MSWWAWLLLGVGVLIIIWAGFVVWLVAAGRRTDAGALARFIPDCIVLVPRLARDLRVPRRSKLLLLGLVGYLALPFDLVPDFIPLAGSSTTRSSSRSCSGDLVRAGCEPLIRELWPGPERSLALILRLA